MRVVSLGALALFGLMLIPSAAAEVCVAENEVELHVGSPSLCPRPGTFCPGALWDEGSFDVTTPRVCVG